VFNRSPRSPIDHLDYTVRSLVVVTRTGILNKDQLGLRVHLVEANLCNVCYFRSECGIRQPWPHCVCTKLEELYVAILAFLLSHAILYY